MFQYLNVVLTGNVPVPIFESTEVCHELPHRNFEDFKQTRILKKGVSHLWEQKPALLKYNAGEKKNIWIVYMIIMRYIYWNQKRKMYMLQC